MARRASLVYTCDAPAPATASNHTSTALICSRYTRYRLSTSSTMDKSLDFLLSSSKRSMELRDGWPQSPEDDNDGSMSSHSPGALLLTPFMACQSPWRLQNSVSKSCAGPRYLELLSWNGCMLGGGRWLLGACSDTAAGGTAANWSWWLINSDDDPPAVPS